MAASSTLDTQHTDMIHDAQLDYYGKRLATCSSDRTIKIFELSGGDAAGGSGGGAAGGSSTGGGAGGSQQQQAQTQTQVAELKGHEGPVWQVAWAHPKFGSVLASCSYDQKVIVWKEAAKNQWTIAYEYSGHELSVNSIAWAPYEFGLVLACASSDSYLSVLTHKSDGSWEAQRLPAHQIGVNAVSWAPAVAPAALLNAATPVSYLNRFVSGGCDSALIIWRLHEGQWEREDELKGHTDWVRDVAWAPNIGLPGSTIASCGQDNQVIIWTQEDPAKREWQKKALPRFDDVVWRVSWSVVGNILAVSCGDGKVSLWKEALDGEWTRLSVLE